MQSRARFSSDPARRTWTWVGTVVAAVPLLLGIVMAAMTLGGRFGGPGNAPVALWYIPLETGGFALLGGIVLLWAQRSRPGLRPVLGWGGTAAFGYLFVVVSGQLSGLATTPWEQTLPWQRALLAAGVATYLVGLLGLVATGWRLGRGGRGDRGVRGGRDGRSAAHQGVVRSR